MAQRRLLVLTAICLLLPAAPGTFAADRWALCGDVGRPPPHPALEPVENNLMQILADQGDMVEGGPTTFQGRVQIQHQGRWLTADRVLYNPDEETVDTFGATRYWDEDTYASGTSAHYELTTELGWVDDVSFRLLDRHGRGHADTINFGASQVLIAQNAEYTTCNPGDVDWFIEAKTIKLDKEKDVGTAKNVWLHFKGMPVAYSPRLSFPLSDKRKTGFLAPAFGSSGESGAELYVPFYWNIAPQQDATFGLRGMQDRGVMYTGEYRYLMRSGSGMLQAEFLADDMESNNNREFFVVEHKQTLTSRLSTNIEVRRVSDKEYFEELGTNLAVSSTRYLPRRGELRYQAKRWYALGRVENIQTVDNTIGRTDEPYNRMPQVLTETAFPERSGKLSPQFRGEVVRFDRDEGVEGKRLDVRPSVSFPLRSPGAFLVPKATLRYTAYDLSDTEPDQDDDPDRLIPSVSVDSGLVFERAIALRNRSFLQTLEPRAYYLYTTRKNQSDIPVFDTGQYTFGFAQLFREDRFTGADRIGDANQVSLALTTRLLDPYTGVEPFRASIGRIYYLKDRKVALEDQLPASDNTSDIVGELVATIPGGWRAYGDLQWDTDRGRSNRGTLSIRYKPDQARVLNLSYRFVRSLDDVEARSVKQADLTFRWPVNPKWSLVGRWNHAIGKSQLLEAFGGFEYHSCCWGMRAVARRFLNNSDGNHTNQLFFQLELKGLGGIGGKTVDFLEQQIPGYENEF